MATLIFSLGVLLFSVIIHEIAHGAVAYRLGDETAYRLGRLTLNPLAHIDPFGSIILPLFLALPALAGLPTVIVGYAKPVPYDPRFLKNPVRDAGLIAIAGPASNIVLAIAFTALLAFINPPAALTEAFRQIILINLSLAVFNLVPIPPLDGSKVLATLLPHNSQFLSFLERHGMTVFILFILFGLNAVGFGVRWLFAALMALFGIGA